MNNKVKVLSNGFLFNKHLNIDISQDFDFIYDDNVESIINEELSKNINPIVDIEISKYKLDINDDFKISFVVSGSNDYITSTLFNYDNIINLSPTFYNSFWIIDYYDTFNNQIQNKLYTQFYKPERKIVNNILDSKISINFKDNNSITNNDYSNIFIPNNKNLSSNIIYLKFRFFCAKTGKIFNFKKLNLTNIYNEIDYYFQVTIDNISKKYYISTDDITFQPTFSNYENILEQTNINNNNVPIINTNNNSDKGDFINTEGKYQKGDIVDNSNCN